jgi:hypothetical protein
MGNNNFDPAIAVNSALNRRDINFDLETYVFIVFDAAKTRSSKISANNLLEKIAEINEKNTKLHISVISDSSTYEDTAFLPTRISSTQGTIIAPRSADEVSADVLEYLRAEVVERNIIVSSVSVKLMPEKFNSEYITKISTGTDEDYDGDGLTDDLEIDFDSPLIKNMDGNIILPKIVDCVSYVSELLGTENDMTRVEEFADKEGLPLDIIHFAPLNSDPTAKDTDEDGIIDGKFEVRLFNEKGEPIWDSAPNQKGVFTNESGPDNIVTGEITIISCSNAPAGHGFLIYKSFINDNFDFTGFARGFQFGSTAIEMPTDNYVIGVNEYLTIGSSGDDITQGTADGIYNFMAGGNGELFDFGPSTNIFEDEDELNDGDLAGSYYNREFAFVLDRYNKYISGEVDQLEKVYDLNYALTKQLPLYGIEDIIHTFKIYNWYNLATLNCADLAVIAWQKIFRDFPIDYYEFARPAKLKEVISEQDGSYVFNIHKEVFGYNV